MSEAGISGSDGYIPGSGIEEKYLGSGIPGRDLSPEGKAAYLRQAVFRSRRHYHLAGKGGQTHIDHIIASTVPYSQKHTKAKPIETEELAHLDGKIVLQTGAMQGIVAVPAATLLYVLGKRYGNEYLENLTWSDIHGYSFRKFEEDAEHLGMNALDLMASPDARPN